MSALLLLLGLVLLLVGGTGLVSGASAVATRFGVPAMVVGLTVVAFGTSAPELVVNIIGAMRGETDLAFGNIIGSNLANLGLVLGSAALVCAMQIEGKIVTRELPLLMLGTCILAVMTLDRVLQGSDALLTRSDGVILLLLFSIFVYISILEVTAERQDPLFKDIEEFEHSLPGSSSAGAGREWLYVIAGIAGLGLGGHLTIVHGSALAAALGVPPVIIGLLVVAIGTSMPELVTSIIAAMRNEPDLCVGNVVGSNIFNSLLVLPVSALVRPLPIPERGLLDILVSLLFAVAIVPIFLYGRGARMTRPMGALFIAVYLGYMGFRVMTS